MKKRLLLSSLVIFILLGCKSIVMMKYHITNPKIETPESLLGFLKEMNQDPTNVFYFKDSTSFFRYMNDPYYNKHLLTTTFYTEDGLMDQFIDTNKCQWSGGHYVAMLKPDTVYHVDTTHRYQDILRDLLPLFNPVSNEEHGRKCDFIVVTTWAKYLGDYNERLFIVCRGVNENQKITIRFVLLNTDMQQSWNLQKEQMVRFR
jgi:hypothetical protein